jgi:hypothetical protein
MACDDCTKKGKPHTLTREEINQPGIDAQTFCTCRAKTVGFVLVFETQLGIQLLCQKT